MVKSAIPIMSEANEVQRISGFSVFRVSPKRTIQVKKKNALKETQLMINLL